MNLEPKTKAELLQAIDEGYDALERAIAGLEPAQRSATQVVEQQTVKDLLAHITDWEKYVLERFRNAAQGVNLPYRIQEDADLDRINAQVYAANRDRAWDDVYNDFVRVHNEVAAAVRDLREDDLFDPARGLPVMGGAGRRVVDFVVDNTSAHFAEHAAQIAAWRGESA